MSNNIPVASCRHGRLREPSIGPLVPFQAPVVVVVSVFATGLLSDSFAMLAVSTLLFVLATGFALVAWVRCSTDEYELTHEDVAGAVVSTASAPQRSFSPIS
jgi:hypothetical protein